MNDLDLDTSSTTNFVAGVIVLLLRGLEVTLAAALLGYAVSLTLGLLFAILRQASSVAVRWPVICFLEFVRDTPLLIQLFFLYFVLPHYGIVFPAFLTGALAIGLQYSAYSAEVYRAGIEAVGRGQWDAACAMNLSMLRTYRVVIIPQVIPRLVPALGNLLVGILKETPILSTISVIEMLSVANIIGDRTFNYTIPLTVAGVLMLVTTSVASFLVRALSAWLPKNGIPLQ